MVFPKTIDLWNSHLRRKPHSECVRIIQQAGLKKMAKPSVHTSPILAEQKCPLQLQPMSIVSFYLDSQQLASRELPELQLQRPTVHQTQQLLGLWLFSMKMLLLAKPVSNCVNCINPLLLLQLQTYSLLLHFSKDP